MHEEQGPELGRQKLGDVQLTSTPGGPGSPGAQHCWHRASKQARNIIHQNTGFHVPQQAEVLLLCLPEALPTGWG